jgi:GNAT superfamily N-acetyltransferase
MTLALPDVPRWIEAHGIAADPSSWSRPFAVGSPRAKLIVITAAGGDVAALAREFPDHSILSPDEATARATGRPSGKAILMTLPDPDTLPDLEGAALLGDAPLDGVPPALAEELGAADRVWTAWVDGAPVAFAYAPWRSACWFDVSVDVLPGARQLGLGTLVASTMIRDERAAGREPVWGADEDNVASLRLARRLGFQPVDELWISPPLASR